MTTLPIVHMTLYKHGVGFFQRRGSVDAESVTLTFRRKEMDDLLKSLTVIDYGDGQVRGVDYDTPQSQLERLEGCSVILDDTRSLRDLLLSLRGRSVRLQLEVEGSTQTGILVGLDEAGEEPLRNSLVSLLRNESEQVISLPLSRISGVELLDSTAASDLRFFLKTSLGQESHRSITIRLTPGEHDLSVSYIAPAPTWRVSYRFVAEALDSDDPRALLQGWGIFDNRLEEDLNGISLSLTAGMPISFVYDLYTPRTPQRPTVQDEDRVAAAPVMFDAMMALESGINDDEAFGAKPAAPPSPAPMMRSRGMDARSASIADVDRAVQSAATGEQLGELFQYNVSVPVTVGRGQSAMVPIVSGKLKPRKDLIYNGQKMATHPVATMRFTNSTGLTLERGPVTVLDEGEYVGEAVLPFTAPEAEAVISYAVELGVHIRETPKSSTEIKSLAVQHAFLVQEMYEIQQVTYTIDNRTAQPKRVLIEHPKRPNFDLFDTIDAQEQTLDTYRFAVEAAANQASTLVVKTRLLRSRREALQNLNYRGLQQYLKDKLLDQATYDKLKGLLDGRAEISRLKSQIIDLEGRREKIYAAQSQAQKNMQVLSATGEEGQLRRRYVQQLTDSEEELAKIDRSITTTQSSIDTKEIELQQMIDRLG